MSFVEPHRLLHDLYDEEFGFRLTNFSIKPVHVANSLGRALTKRTYDTSALARTLRRYVRDQRLGIDQERNPNAAILQEYGDAFEPLAAAAPANSRVNRLRALAFDALGADGAVFEQADKSSFTFSNERFLTRDPSDDRAGLFLSRLLTAGPGDGQRTAKLIRDLLASETDAWTTLALPLLQYASVREEVEGGEAAARAAKSEHLFEIEEGRLRSVVLDRLRVAYDRLAEFEAISGSKLNSLRRLMLFGCFVVHVHAISRWSQREPGAPRPPILLDLSDGSVVSVRDASRSSLRAAGDALEGLVRSAFRDHVAGNFGKTVKEIEDSLSNVPEASSLMAAYQDRHVTGGDPVDVFAQVMVDAALAMEREHPIGALVELGRRAGFLSPWSNAGRGGKLQKRYTATAEFLEILIGTTVDPDEPLEFPEFLDRLRETFGIVVGRPEDDEVIRRNNLLGDQFGPITAVNEEDLRQNVDFLRQLVVESGYAKGYADGRTMVTTRPEGIL